MKKSKTNTKFYTADEFIKMLNSLSYDTRNTFMTIMTAAICIKEMGQSKEFFLDFSEEVWTNMENNDAKFLKDVLMSIMLEDAKKYNDKKEKEQ